MNQVKLDALSCHGIMIQIKGPFHTGILEAVICATTAVGLGYCI